MSKNLVVAKNVINIYAKPDTSSEVTTQAVFGAKFVEQERTGDFVYVIGEDRYSGWASARFLLEDEAYSVSVSSVDCPMVCELFADVYKLPEESSEQISRLVISTRLATIASLGVPGKEFPDLVAIKYPGGDSYWVKRSCIARPPAIAVMSNWDKSPGQRDVLIKMLGQRVVATAKRLIGTPYLWGGSTPFGIDCSGLVQFSYKIEGVKLLRDTYLQAADKRFIEIESGLPFDKANFLPGDIVVFGTGNKQEHDPGKMHIGIACGEGYFIHSSGRERNFGVYVDSCSEPFYVERYMKGLRLSALVDLDLIPTTSISEERPKLGTLNKP